MKPISIPEPLSVIGEGPVWDETEGYLLWVDINGDRIHRLNPESGKVETIEAPKLASALVPCSNGGWLVSAYHSIYHWIPGKTSFDEVLRLENLPSDVRFNDGKAGPDGGLWIGTMDLHESKAQGALYRVSADFQYEEKLSGIYCSNGLDWSLTHDEMYYIDSHIPRVQAYAFDSKNGTLGQERTAVTLNEKSGLPDGMSIDHKGMIWVAEWGGSRVVRWNPADGSQLSAIEMPVPQPSSCAFGGANYETLFITSAYQGMSDSKRAEYPLSGALFHMETSDLGIRGRRPFRFG
ncbi:SMP-30/gluconolactonase/LRE family protein [Paenibacillus mendelii]|uniref:SMP-30/gluconolactonase/LRE family protein n=1 Tax=Paenibacillus mendelii TaxID=206163 RepID=A0ABV6JKP5_9BACL|nr:SMP-30/gluconolactonase/LRE family protein [Paenibacillus mendelii]MCQ6560670.1 SMP-30/gluconolactonase/LRE family protein [Paenibacillus mendelii]